MSIQLILILEILEIIAIFFECIMVFILYGFPIRIEPLTLLCPLFCCLQRMSLEKFEINGYREDTVACFFLREYIHSMPSICWKFIGASIYHRLKFRQLQEISIQNESNTPKIWLHCMKRRFSVSCNSVTNTCLALNAAKTFLFISDSNDAIRGQACDLWNIHDRPHSTIGQSD